MISLGTCVRREAFRSAVRAALLKVLDRRPELLDDPFRLEEALLRVVDCALDLDAPR